MGKKSTEGENQSQPRSPPVVGPDYDNKRLSDLNLLSMAVINYMPRDAPTPVRLAALKRLKRLINVTLTRLGEVLADPRSSEAYAVLAVKQVDAISKAARSISVQNDARLMLIDLIVKCAEMSTDGVMRDPPPTEFYRNAFGAYWEVYGMETSEPFDAAVAAWITARKKPQAGCWRAVAKAIESAGLGKCDPPTLKRQWAAYRKVRSG
jgi:hypothetical protein